MRVALTMDTRNFDLRIPREAKRLAYNTSESINNTIKEVQADIRRTMSSIFILRRTSKKSRQWLLQQIVIKPFASPRNGVMYAEISIAKKSRLLLAGYETGEQREGFVGKNVANPISEVARAGGTLGGEVRPELTFARLKMKPFQVTPRTRPEGEQFKGAHRTFLLKSTAKAPFGGVYQRVGPKPGDIRMVYSFKREFQLREILKFVQTARITINDRFGTQWVLSNARNPSK